MPKFSKGRLYALHRLLPGMKVGGMVFVSERCAVDSEGNIVGAGDIAIPTERAIQNMQLVL